MVFKAGFQTFEFLHAPELPKPLSFASSEDALTWLKQLTFQHPELMARCREYLSRSSDDPENFRLTDSQAIERLAVLLHTRRVVVIAREFRGGGGTPTASAAAPGPAFPLSERAPRPATVSQPAPAGDPATFSSNVDPTAQSNALVAAAADGKPFCPE
jgi:hypothetical protein